MCALPASRLDECLSMGEGGRWRILLSSSTHSPLPAEALGGENPLFFVALAHFLVPGKKEPRVQLSIIPVQRNCWEPETCSTCDFDVGKFVWARRQGVELAINMSTAHHEDGASLGLYCRPYVVKPLHSPILAINSKEGLDYF